MIFNKFDYNFLCFILNNFKIVVNLFIKYLRFYVILNRFIIIVRLGVLIMGLMGFIFGKLYDKYGICVLVIVGFGIIFYVIYEFIKFIGGIL